jgi:hypothetical protein
MLHLGCSDENSEYERREKAREEVISAPVVLRMRSGPAKVPPTTEGGREMT